MERLEFKVISAAGTEIEIVKELPPPLLRAGLSPYETMLAKAGFADMLYNSFKGDGFTIWYSIYNVHTTAIAYGLGDVAILELHIPLWNDFISKWDGRRIFSLRSQQLNLSYLPHVHNEVRLEGGQSYHTFDIHFTKAYLQKFSKHYPKLDVFLERLERKEPVSLMDSALFLAPDMIRLIHAMTHFNLRDEAAPFFFESAVLQLTTLILDRLMGLHPEQPRIFTAYEQECTIAARDTMLSDLSRRYSIKELAKKAGINEWTLQHCFKQLYHTTLFQYGQFVRMEYAAHLLLDSKHLSIQEIGELAGYRDHPNFTAAFKRQFHCTPEYYRREGKPRPGDFPKIIFS